MVRHCQARHLLYTSVPQRQLSLPWRAGAIPYLDNADHVSVSTHILDVLPVSKFWQSPEASNGARN